jgi:hypothetical protein
LFAQKKEQEKGTRLSRPPTADTLRFSLSEGRKITRLRLKQFLRLFPPTTVMLSAKEWGSKDKEITVFKNTISHSRTTSEQLHFLWANKENEQL